MYCASGKMSDISIDFNSSYLLKRWAIEFWLALNWLESENPFSYWKMRQIIVPNLNNIWKGCVRNHIDLTQSHPLSHYKYRKSNTCLLLFASVELVFDPFFFLPLDAPFLFLFPKCLLIFNSNSFIFLRLPLNWLGHRMDTWTRSLVFQFYAGRFTNENCIPDTYSVLKKEIKRKILAHLNENVAGTLWQWEREKKRQHFTFLLFARNNGIVNNTKIVGTISRGQKCGCVSEKMQR